MPGLSRIENRPARVDLHLLRIRSTPLNCAQMTVRVGSTLANHSGVAVMGFRTSSKLTASVSQSPFR